MKHKFGHKVMGKTALILGTAIASLAVAMPTTAAAQDVEVSAGVDYVTEYVFRGVSLADEAWQPYIEAGFGDFTVGVWASLAAGEGSDDIDEVDLYASYSLPVGEGYSVDLGATYYHYPAGGGLFETEDGAAGTYEIFGSVGFDLPLEPSITAFYDLTLEAFTVEGGIAHSLPLGEMLSVDLGASAGLVDGDGFSYEYGSASAALSVPLGESASGYVGANLALSSEDSLNFKELLAGGGRSDHVWLGVGVSTSF